METASLSQFTRPKPQLGQRFVVGIRELFGIEINERTKSLY